MFHDIEGLHWAFRSPVTGPGIYVLLCDRDRFGQDDFRFVYDPWLHNRARKHYAKACDCHNNHFRDDEIVSEQMIMERFGYLG